MSAANNSKRQKLVFPTNEIPHLWAHRTQPEARNSQRNLYFENDTIYSYGGHFPIARHVFVGKRNPKHYVLLTSRTYSVTTSGHVNAVHCAIPRDVRTFEVPSVLGSWGSEANHADNLKYFETESQRLFTQATNARKQGLYCLDAAFALQTTAKEYAKAFKVPTSNVPKFAFLPKGSDLVALRTKLSLRQQKADIKDKVEREKRNAEFERRAAIAALELAERIELWKQGNPDVYLNSWDANVPTLLRVRGDEVETSKGARVPVHHAIRGLKFVRSVVASGTEFIRNGHTFHLGHYSIDKVTTDGTLYAGCHVIPYSEIERIAPELEAYAVKSAEILNTTQA